MDTLPTEVVSHIISYLDLRSQLQLSAVSVRWREAVSDCLRRRRSLDMKDMELRFWTDAMLQTLLPRLPALRVLQVHMLDSGRLKLDVVSQNCPQLEKLNMTPFRLDVESVERLCRRCPRLWDVSMPDGCSSKLLELLLRRLPGVRVLKLRSMDVSAAAVALLPAGLERLAVHECTLPVIPRQPTDRWPQLTELSAHNHMSELNGTDSARGMAALVAGCPRLQRLDGSFSFVDDHLLDVLPAVQMQHLDLNFCDDLTEDALVNCLRRLRHLRTPGLSGGPHVTDHVLETLVGIETLTELEVGNACGWTLFSMEALQQLVVASSSLRVLRLSINDEEDLEALVVGLDSQLDRDRDVTLFIPDDVIGGLTESVLPAESSPLRVVAW